MPGSVSLSLPPPDCNAEAAAPTRIPVGFSMRTTGSHHIFSREAVTEILNLQPRRDGTAKPYQVKQVRQVITRYRIAGEDNAI